MTKLRNLKQLAADLGVAYHFTLGLAAAGMPLPGGRTTKKAALQWMTDHPDFEPTAALEKARSQRKEIWLANYMSQHGCGITQAEAAWDEQFSNRRRSGLQPA